MYLKKLELQGFKSFARKTTLNFEEGSRDGRRIAAIVGPNGTGKSNIADAVRWVLGEQSLKALRGKKTEDIIFAGTDKKARLGRAEVSLYLDNSDQRMPLDYSEVVLSRRVFRDGESEYLINQNPVRRLDIVELLAKAGFGQATYAVIGQGMVDAVLSATPVERKVLFEEATGVKKYYLKRDRAARKLEHTRDNLTRIKDIVTELEPRLRILKRQAKRAQERGKVEEELREFQGQYYSFVYGDLNQKLKTVLDKTARHQANIDQETKELERLQSEIKALEQATRDVLGEDQEKQEEITALEEKRLDFHQKLAVLEGKIEAEEERGGEDPQILKAKEVSFKEELQKIEIQIKELGKEEAELKQSLEEDASQKAELDQQLAMERGKLKELGSAPQKGGQFQADYLKKEVKIILGEQAEILSKIDSIQDLSELESLKQMATELQKRLRKLADLLEKNGDTEIQKKLLKIQGQINQFVQRKEELDQKQSDLKIRVAKIEQKLEFLVDSREEKRSKLDEIELRLGKEDQEEKSVITNLLRRKRDYQNQLKEVENRLKDLKDELSSRNREYQNKRAGLLEKERSYQVKQQEIEKARIEMNQVEVEKVRFETKLEDLEEEIRKEVGEGFVGELKDGGKLQPSSKQGFELSDKVELEEKIVKLKRKLELSGGIDPEVIKEYEECQERYDFLTRQSEDLGEASGSLAKVIRKLDGLIKKQFNEYFEKISVEFDHYFKKLFEGGKANLVLIEDEETEQSTVEIKAHLPGKRLKTIDSLSGGERALTSVALLFAILAVNPSPFCVLDEVDAALDEANSKKFGEILESLAERTQFILITHNRETMRRSYLLYGVTMEEGGVSKLLSIKLEEGEELVKQRKDRRKGT
ncbi:hypothetical protein E3J85_02530 [Patescibacteria group bacterium]|nr:MAG: hypothetical protein E3J85_02530 [Patescibacteria group bacterium]